MSEAPKTFLRTISRFDTGEIVGLTSCAGFDLDIWRAKKLAEHLVNWLPHFALRQEEIDQIGGENPFTLLKTAAARVFKSQNFERRGEIGELLLHIISVTEYRAYSFVSRLFYKMRTNDQVTGFDSALITVAEGTEDIELWLGEAKFYENTDGAIAAAIKSINGHLDAGFLEETKILVGPKIEKNAPAYEKIQWLFDDGNTLDELISAIVIPVLIASESKAAKNYSKAEEDKYNKLVIEEYEYIRDKFEKHGISKKIKLVLIYVPMSSKATLENEFAKKIGLLE